MKKNKNKMKGSSNSVSLKRLILEQREEMRLDRERTVTGKRYLSRNGWKVR